MKNFKIILICVLTISVVICFIDNKEKLSDWLEYKQIKTFYINEKGEYVLNKHYDVCSSQFKNGLATVKKNGKYGYMNTKGKITIPFIYDLAFPFSNKTALVKKNDLLYYIEQNGNKKGNYCVSKRNLKITPEGSDLTYNVGDFINDLAITWDNKLIDNNCNYLLNKNYDIKPEKLLLDKKDFYIIEDNNSLKQGLIDHTGKTIIQPIFDKIFLPSENYCVVVKNKKYGLFDITGKKIIDYKYDFLGNLSDGLIFYCIENKTGYMDIKENTILSVNCEKGSDFKNGFAIIQNNNNSMCINKQGNIIFKNKGKFITRMNNIVQIDKDVYDINGDYYGQYDSLQYVFDENLSIQKYLIVNKNGKMGVVDYKFNEIIPVKYDCFSNLLKNNTFLCKNKNICYYIDINNNIKLQVKAEAITHFDEGVATIYKKNLWYIFYR